MSCWNTVTRAASVGQGPRSPPLFALGVARRRVVARQVVAGQALA
ncbi:hypothetical protein SAMN06272739_4465 [Blastococcus haudaquaticus]|uniref:Uncharacterized protein n=1 Tax=Blastococcus haudaquaticus TaxID=1938745 RepID=A0A286H8P1_9ACTN|nr:hypothetical protein SAMN06272739_4465 [Blastococcus haudaquaticus]